MKCEFCSSGLPEPEHKMRCNFTTNSALRLPVPLSKNRTRPEVQAPLFCPGPHFFCPESRARGLWLIIRSRVCGLVRATLSISLHAGLKTHKTVRFRVEAFDLALAQPSAPNSKSRQLSGASCRLCQRPCRSTRCMPPVGLHALVSAPVSFSSFMWNSPDD